jgi:hypothetical protein
MMILTETKEEEKKKSNGEHGPRLYVNVEESEGPSRGREGGCSCGCQHNSQSAESEGKKELE